MLLCVRAEAEAAHSPVLLFPETEIEIKEYATMLPRTSSFHWEWKFQLPVSAHWAWSISVVRIRPITPSVITKGAQS